MKDLKHLIFFENLLQDAQNELVEKARNEGQLALGYNCYYIPEVLLNLPGCFSSRLRAPRCTSTDIAGYYMTNRSCPYARSILERATYSNYEFLVVENNSTQEETFAYYQKMEAEHASITLARGKYYLADLNSRSGTLLNGQPVEPGRTYELSSADLITIAGEELVFSRRSQ